MSRSSYPPPATISKVPITLGNAIQLQDLSINNNVRTYSSCDSYASSDDDDDDEVQFSRDDHHPNNPSRHQHKRQDSSSPQVEELPPLSCSVTGSDVFFNAIVCILTVIHLTVDITLIFYHYNTGDKWASGLTAACVCSGGVALLRQFWMLTYEQLDGIYYERSNCVRISVNCAPWVATIITSYQTLFSSLKARSTPMAIRTYVKLQELSNSLLRIQALTQCSPQALLQLVVLLEDDEISWIQGILQLSCILVCLTIMMVCNLPIKSDDGDDTPKSAAYNPYTRLFFGLRMLSSFGSRTLSLSILFSTSRCITFKLLDSPSHIISHSIPLALLFIPRLLFTIVDYTYTRVSASRQRATMQECTELEAISPIHKTRFSGILVGYCATVFILFSEPVWIFYYVSVETVVFVILGIGGEVSTGGQCLGWSLGGGILILFVVLFVVVPTILPYANQKVREVVRGRRRI